MIKSITIQNFFSFGSKQTVVLNLDVNVLVGINGSGKSNFIKAIQLLHDSIAGKRGFESLFLKDWSGFTSVCNFSKTQADSIKITYEFDCHALNEVADANSFRFPNDIVYEITIHKSGSGGYYLSELIFSQNKNKKQLPPFNLLKMRNGRGEIETWEGGQISTHKYPQEEKQLSFKTEETVLSQISDPERFYPLFTLKRAIEEIVVYDYFDTTQKSPIRQLSAFGVENKLLPNGENLVQILQKIKNHHSLAYEKIEELLASINPMFKDISFDFLGSKSLLVLREKQLDKSISVEHISDGTLRFLLLLAILYNPQKGKLICIDEPEIGLHPDMIKTIAKAIKYAAKQGTQMIIATHSPLLLNNFELEDIWVFEKNKANETVVSCKSEEYFANWNDSFLSGQLWLNGQLGGVRW